MKRSNPFWDYPRLSVRPIIERSSRFLRSFTFPQGPLRGYVWLVEGNLPASWRPDAHRKGQVARAILSH